jgi:Glyoxalase-like domain
VATGIQVVIDCGDPERLGAFWAAALGYKVQDPPNGFPSWQAFLTAQGVPESEWNSANAIVDPDQRGPRLFFQRVPEAKSVKNRLHLDLNVTRGPLAESLEQRHEQVGAEVARLQGLGAKELQAHERRNEYWVVMQDPEGNEFCVH